MANFHIIQDHLQSILQEEVQKNKKKVKGNKFEHICKWFLENDPYYKQKFEKIWLWDDWDEPEKWHPREKGADLIAKTFDGKRWGIQAKAYKEDYYINKPDIDTFLTETNRAVITHRLLIATTNKIGPNADETLKGQEKPVTCINLDALENSDLDWSLALKSKQKPPKKIYKPHPHQQEAIDAIVNGFAISDQGQVHMACGTGKSLIGLWTAQRLQAHRILVLVPSLNLVSQLYKTWAAHCADLVFRPIFVCSDKTVTDKQNDEFDITPLEFGYPVTTSAQELATLLTTNTSIATVVFATYQSSDRLQEACTINPEINFDLVIADEAHRCTGKDTSDFTIITRKDAIKATRKLYMTATPKIYSDNVKTKTKEVGMDIASMNDLEKFGPVFYTLFFSQGIKQKLLTDYHVYVSVISDKMYKEYADKGTFVRTNQSDTDARTLATQIYAAKTIKKLGLKNVISFHNGRPAAKNFIESFEKNIQNLSPAEKPIVQFSDVITGEQPQSKRNKILQCFNQTTDGQVSIVGNVKCLSEGVDVPAIDGILFVDPKGSDIDIIQSVGRVMRRSANKTIGSILIPVFVNTDNDEKIELENSCFKNVWRVVRALRSHDDTFAEEIDHMRFELGKRIYKAPPKLSKITLDVSIELNADFALAISYKLVERCGQITLDMSHPEIAAQWHPTKNGDLKPSDVTSGSSKKVWWKCIAADDHEWKTSIGNRCTGNTNCPCCTNQIIVLSNCLATTHPHLVKEWHPTKNGLLTLYEVGAGSGKKAWWKCSIADDHEWQTAIEKRTKEKTKCPMCSGFIAVLSNCLATTYPQIAAQWHPTKNEITPYDVVAGSEQKIWWQCNKNINHVWLATVYRRAKSNAGCHFCKGKQIHVSESLGSLYPEVAAQWDQFKNNQITPFDIHPGSNKQAWWKCPTAEDHKWKTAVYRRVSNSKCPMCVNRVSVKSNCLATTHSEIAAQWHPTKNGNLTPYDVTAGSNRRVWWKCSLDSAHEWQTTIKKRSNERTNCPLCYKESRRNLKGRNE